MKLLLVDCYLLNEAFIKLGFLNFLQDHVGRRVFMKDGGFAELGFWIAEIVDERIHDLCNKGN